MTVNSFDRYTWANIPAVSNFMNNSGGIFGLEDGEHLYPGEQIVSGLIDGEAERLILAIKRARTDWLSRQCV